MDAKRHHAQCYAALNALAPNGAIVLAGSSLCEQFPVNELLMSQGEALTVYNRGISGDTLAGYAGRIRECVLDLQPEKLFINIGTNDVNVGACTNE